MVRSSEDPSSGGRRSAGSATSRSRRSTTWTAAASMSSARGAGRWLRAHRRWLAAPLLRRHMKKTDYTQIFGRENKVMVQAVAGGEPRTLIENTKDISPRWSGDGRTYVYTKEGQLFVPASTAASRASWRARRRRSRSRNRPPIARPGPRSASVARRNASRPFGSARRATSSSRRTTRASGSSIRPAAAVRSSWPRRARGTDTLPRWSAPRGARTGSTST